MSREDFVTEPADVPILQIQFHGEGGWPAHVRCFRCEESFEEGVLSFYLDELPLCWGCAPPAAKVFAQAQYRVYSDPDPHRRWRGGSVLEHGCAIDESFDAAAIGASV